MDPSNIQLTLFERAGDLIDPDKFRHVDVTGRDVFGEVDREHHNRVFLQKLNASKTDRWLPGSHWRPDPSLYSDIEENGVKTPIPIKLRRGGNPMVEDGHHRIAAMNDIDPDAYIPVTWRD